MSPDDALRIARAAHDGQVDKAGKPYIGHIMRVIGHLPDDATDDHRVVAALHDVVEDTDTTLGDLRAAGLTPVQADAVDAMTHRPGELRSAYYRRVKGNPVALVVKEADLADNADPERLAALDQADRQRLTMKYDKARLELGLAPTAP